MNDRTDTIPTAGTSFLDYDLVSDLERRDISHLTSYTGLRGAVQQFHGYGPVAANPRTSLWRMHAGGVVIHLVAGGRTR